jgi:hypothetical protein
MCVYVHVCVCVCVTAPSCVCLPCCDIVPRARQGMDALNEGNLEEAERLYAAATRAHEGLQPANVDLAANVKALNRSVQAAQQARIKRTVLALMDQARRELGCFMFESLRVELARKREFVRFASACIHPPSCALASGCACCVH